MAKPEGWEKMPFKAKQAIGMELFASMRGQYIVSQALSKAIDVMKKDKHPEYSNIEDMEVLHETVFPIYQKEIMEMTLEKFEQLVKKKKEVVE